MSQRLPLLTCIAFVAGCANGLARPVVPDADRSRAAPLTTSVTARSDAWVLMGEAALARGDAPVARQAYLEAVALTDDGTALARAIDVIAATGDMAPARTAIARWLELEPESGTAWRWRLTLTLSERELDAARAAAERLYALEGAAGVSTVLLSERPAARALKVAVPLGDAHPDDPALAHAVALLAERTAQLGVASRFATRALELRPGWHDALVLKARAELRAGGGRAALADLERAQRAEPRVAGLAVPTASLLVDAGDAPAGRAVLDAYLKLVPGDLDVRYARALLLAQGVDREAATREFKLLAESGVRSDEAPYWLGLIAEESGREVEALDWYRRVGDAGPLPTAVLRAARIVAKREGINDGRRVIAEVRNARPEYAADLLVGEAQLLNALGQPSAARALLDALLTESPDDENLLRRRADLAARLGDPQTAVRDLRVLLARRPDDPQLLNALGYTLADAGLELAEARRLLDAALAGAPDEPAILDSAGWVRFRQGEHAAARPLLERAWLLARDAEIGAHLGELLWVMGEQDAAIKVWDAAHGRDPDDLVLSSTLSRLKR
jgi:tetratricopeptide (TPR) repeat protein